MKWMDRLKEIFEGFTFVQKATVLFLLAGVLTVLFLIVIKEFPFGSVPKDIPGVNVRVLERGEGEVMGEVMGESGIAVISYIAKLQDGVEFARSESFRFALGDGTVLKAWEEGMKGMRVGDTRMIEIEPENAYGEQGIPGLVPPNSKVIFEITLIEFLAVNK